MHRAILIAESYLIATRLAVPKQLHEIRDPIHVFVRMDSHEREVLDSAPFQRLRHIHQLALTYVVYPGMTHRRFEHSLGFMELASRVFDIVTDLMYSAVVKQLPVVSADFVFVDPSRYLAAKN